jgi:1-acyl-sn-glycerol-3-phosphate acyltransferase
MRYRVLQFLTGLLASLQMRLHVVHRDALPSKGPVLLISNHLGITDPLVIALPLRRPVRILAKAEIFDWPLIGWLARQAGVVPVHRGEADRGALRSVSQLLADKECVLVFPEGTYHYPPESPGMLPIKPGAAWLALRTGALVVPVAIWGTELVWEPARGWRPWIRPTVHVVFGEPYYPELPPGGPTRRILDIVSAEMACKIADLLPLGYRGEYSPVFWESVPASAQTHGSQMTDSTDSTEIRDRAQADQ